MKSVPTIERHDKRATAQPVVVYAMQFQMPYQGILVPERPHTLWTLWEPTNVDAKMINEPKVRSEMLGALGKDAWQRSGFDFLQVMVQCWIVFQERHHFIQNFIGVYVNVNDIDEIVVLVVVVVVVVVVVLVLVPDHDSEVVYKGVLLQ